MFTGIPSLFSSPTSSTDLFPSPTISLYPRTKDPVRIRFPLSCILIVDGIERLSERAVHIEPPVADEVLLLEDCSVGTEEAVLGQTSVAVITTDVEHLTLSLGVGIVTSLHQPIADEGGVRHLGVDGIVVPGDPWDVLLQGLTLANSSTEHG